jgi:hypothetical protein
VNAGIPLGVLVGFLSGGAFVLCLVAARNEKTLQAVASIAGIPTSCFGGGWLTTLFDVDDILSAYVTALAATTVVVGIVPLVALVVYATQRLLEPRPPGGAAGTPAAP